MSEERGEVIVPAGRRYQQKQHELLPAAKGLTTPTVVRFLVSNYALSIRPAESAIVFARKYYLGVT